MTINIGVVVTHGQEEYVIKDLLNQGGFGRAFLAERTKPAPKQVVVKVPAAHVLTNPIWSKKFEREARILANISHPNVVKIIAFWEFDGGEKALVQELVDGASDLSSYIKAQPTAAPSAFLQTLYALRAFHTQAAPAVVHRDLSPQNILASKSGRVNVIDFGLAKEDPRATAILTVTGEWFGTAGCMAPEQLLDSASVDHRADLFAVGRSFTAALQARNPQHADPQKLREPWRTICAKLTEHDADDRFASAEDAVLTSLPLFAAAGLAIENFEVHAKEWRGVAAPNGWPELCERHFLALPDVQQEDIEDAASLDASVFAGAFDVNRVFDRVEASSAIKNLDAGQVFFAEGDAVGTLYVKMYPHLHQARKEPCFERLCTTAMRLHRYSVMRDVRRAYESEADASIKARLVQILDRVDSMKTIHGRGIIPGRP